MNAIDIAGVSVNVTLSDWEMSKGKLCIKSEALHRLFFEIGGEILTHSDSTDGTAVKVRILDKLAWITMSMDSTEKAELEITGVYGEAGRRLIARTMSFLFDLDSIDFGDQSVVLSFK